MEGRGWSEGGGGKGMGWNMQITSVSVATSYDMSNCGRWVVQLVVLLQYGQPLPLTVYSACAHHIRLRALT